HEIRALGELVGQETPETARLRDGEAARLRAGAARDVGERAGAAAAQTGSRDRRVGRMNVPAFRPAKEQVLLRRYAGGAVAERFGERSENPQLRRREIAKHRRHGHEHVAWLHLTSDVRGRPVEELTRKHRQLRHDPWLNARARGYGGGRPRPNDLDRRGVSPQRFWLVLDGRVLRIERQRRASFRDELIQFLLELRSEPIPSNRA